MLTRRAFVAALAGLPVIGKVLPFRVAAYVNSAYPRKLTTQSGSWRLDFGPRYFVSYNAHADSYVEVAREEYIRVTGDTSA